MPSGRVPTTVTTLIRFSVAMLPVLCSAKGAGLASVWHGFDMAAIVSRLLLAAARQSATGLLAQSNCWPWGTCPGSRNVLINSPSPQTVKPAKFLNHFP